MNVSKVSQVLHRKMATPSGAPPAAAASMAQAISDIAKMNATANQAVAAVATNAAKVANASAPVGMMGGRRRRTHRSRRNKNTLRKTKSNLRKATKSRKTHGRRKH